MNATDRTEPQGVKSATGRDRAEWFALLDTWGASGRPYREIAGWLTGEHQLSKWWAQKLIVEYEQARGLRDPGIRRDGTFEVGASKTVAVPADRVLAAIDDAALRERWLPSAAMRERGPRSEGSLRFDWQDGPSRIVISLTSAGTNKCQIALLHQRIPDGTTAAEMRSFWRQRLTALKALLEG